MVWHLVFSTGGPLDGPVDMEISRCKETCEDGVRQALSKSKRERASDDTFVLRCQNGALATLHEVQLELGLLLLLPFFPFAFLLAGIIVIAVMKQKRETNQVSI